MGQRWMKKKKAPKNAKGKERDYAVKTQKIDRAKKAINEAADRAAADALADASLSKSEVMMQVQVAVREEAAKAVAEDMTGTLKPFTTKEVAEMAKEAISKVKKEKKE